MAMAVGIDPLMRGSSGAESLLGLKGGPGADGLVPAIDDVIADCRYADGAAA